MKGNVSGIFPKPGYEFTEAGDEMLGTIAAALVDAMNAVELACVGRKVSCLARKTVVGFPLCVGDNGKSSCNV